MGGQPEATWHMRFRLYPHWHDLPAGYADLFARAGADDFCLSQAWFEAFAATVLGHGERLAIAGVEADTPPGMPLACLVGRHRERDPRSSARAASPASATTTPSAMRRSSMAAMAARPWPR